LFIDTHCHLDAAEFDADRDAVAARARAAGVEVMVVPAVACANFQRCAKPAAAMPGVSRRWAFIPCM
jgi:TatD DNase family protein